MTTVSGSSQSDIGDSHLEIWLNSSIKPSSPAVLWAKSWQPHSHSSGEVFLCWLSNFFMKLYFSPDLPKRWLMVSVLTDISLPDLIGCDAWNNSVTIGNIFVLVLLLSNVFL